MGSTRESVDHETTRCHSKNSVLGAIILTGFLGGAVTSHLRVVGTLTPEMIVSLILKPPAQHQRLSMHRRSDLAALGCSDVKQDWNRYMAICRELREQQSLHTHSLP